MKEIVDQLRTEFGLYPVMALELEFYMPPGKAWLEEIAARLAMLPLYRIEAERGPSQYEFSLKPSRDIAQLIADAERAKTLLPEADFSALPHPGQAGSGLHLHIHLEDEQGRNQYTRAGTEWDSAFSDCLLHSLGGLLALLPESMPVFAPDEISRARYREDQTHQVPKTISWGINNRTAALRLPGKAIDNKHIEHRIPCANADIAACVQEVLRGVHYGLVHRCDPGAPVYGDAALPQYGKPPLFE